MNKQYFEKLNVEKLAEFNKHNELQKVELGLVDDVEKLLEKAEKSFKDAKDKLAKAKDVFSNTLILADQNIPPNLKKAQQAAKDLGIDDVVNKLDKIESRAKEIVESSMKIYKNI